MKSKRNVIYLVVILLGIAGVVYPIAYSQLNSASYATNPLTCPPLLPCQKLTPSNTTCSAGQACTIIITSASFTPENITASIGSTIVWVNQDSVTHTSTSYSSNAWDSGLIPPGGSYSLTINSNFVKGTTYYYHCNIHAQMVGAIHVV